MAKPVRGESAMYPPPQYQQYPPQPYGGQTPSYPQHPPPPHQQYHPQPYGGQPPSYPQHPQQFVHCGQPYISSQYERPSVVWNPYTSRYERPSIMDVHRGGASHPLYASKPALRAALPPSHKPASNPKMIASETGYSASRGSASSSSVVRHNPLGVSGVNHGEQISKLLPVLASEDVDAAKSDDVEALDPKNQ